jgi:hypothetical protein
VRRLVFVLSVLASAPLHAAPESEADKLFAEGRDLAKAGNYREACDRFQRSFAVDHAPGTELNLGDCHEHLGHLRKAWQLYTSAADEWDKSGESSRAKFARDKADAVAAKLAEVVVDVAEPDATGLVITIAGHEVKPSAEIHDRVEPGTVTVTAHMPGHPDFQTVVTGVAANRVAVAIPAFAAVPPPPATAAVSDDRHRSRVHVAYWLAAGGGASAVASLAFTLVGKSHYNTAADGPHCMHVGDNITCDSTGKTSISDAQHLADVGTGFFVGAGVLLAASAIVYLTAPPESTVVVPTATAQSVGFTVVAHF